jgi:hypothetical protein
MNHIAQAWCLAAIVTHALALFAAGDVTARSLIMPVSIGLAALLLRWADAADEPVMAEPEGQLPAEPAPVAAPARTSTRSLWSRRTA